LSGTVPTDAIAVNLGAQVPCPLAFDLLESTGHNYARIDDI